MNPIRPLVAKRKASDNLKLGAGVLKANDFQVDANGKLTVNNADVARLIEANLNKVKLAGGMEQKAISVSVGIDF